MNKYILMNHNRRFVTCGTSKAIGEFLGVTRQAISKASNGTGTIRGYLIESYPYYKEHKKSQKWYFGKAIELLKNARAIIDDYNVELIERNEYANINIIMRIDKLLKDIQ